MFLNNMRVAVFVAYVIAYIGSACRLAGEQGWQLIGLLLLANLVLSLADRLWAEWQVRRYVRALRSLAPVRAAKIVQNMFWKPARDLFAERLRGEGEVETEGVVERFPFSARDRRENTILFWLTALGVVLTVASEFTRLAPSRLLAAAVVVLLMALLVWLRRAERELSTVIVVSPFSVAEQYPDGRRRSLTLDGPMELRLNRRRGRVELSPHGDHGFIALDFRRIGFERMLDRVLEYGGFRAAREADEAARKAAQAAPSADAGPAVSAPRPSVQDWRTRLRPIRRRVERGAAIVIPILTVLVLVRMEIGGSRRDEQFERMLPVDASRMFAQRMQYARRVTDPYHSEADASWQYLVIPCEADSVAAWCVIADGDTTVLARETLAPLSVASGLGENAVTTRYTRDTVRTNYVIDVPYGGDRLQRHATVRRRPGAWPEGFVSQLVVALALPAARSLVPLQPRTEGAEDIERTLPDEDWVIARLLQEDTAVAWALGRDSGRIPVVSVNAVPVDVSYRATVLTVRYPDRTVTLWVTDSNRVIVRRETRFRTGLIGTVMVDSLISAAPLNRLR